MKVHRRVIRSAIAQLVQVGLLSRPHHSPIVVPRETRSTAGARPASPSLSQFSASRLVALVMWHGGAQERAGTAQQRIFWGMNQALGQAGNHGVFLDLGEDVGSEQENAAREAAHLRYVLEQGFGGVIFYAYAYRSNRELIQEVARHVPLVLIDRTLSGVQADFVGIQNHQAMADATTHLIQRGHTRIAYVTKAETINSVQDRLQGYLHAVRTTHVPDVQEIVLTTPSADGPFWPVFDTMSACRRASAPRRRYASTTTRRCGSRIASPSPVCPLPNDLSLIGCDNVVHTLPNGVGLTTIAQPYEEIGRNAVKLFLRRIETPAAPQAHVELPTRLVICESTVPPR